MALGSIPTSLDWHKASPPRIFEPTSNRLGSLFRIGFGWDSKGEVSGGLDWGRSGLEFPRTYVEPGRLPFNLPVQTENSRVDGTLFEGRALGSETTREGCFPRRASSVSDGRLTSTLVQCQRVELRTRFETRAEG